MVAHQSDRSKAAPTWVGPSVADADAAGPNAGAVSAADPTTDDASAAGPSAAEANAAGPTADDADAVCTALDYAEVNAANTPPEVCVAALAHAMRYRRESNAAAC